MHWRSSSLAMSVRSFSGGIHLADQDLELFPLHTLLADTPSIPSTRPRHPLDIPSTSPRHPRHTLKGSAWVAQNSDGSPEAHRWPSTTPVATAAANPQALARPRAPANGRLYCLVAWPRACFSSQYVPRGQVRGVELIAIADININWTMR
ncbi:hypothetical protein P154DRAFT_572158 [Amniculicola lignicola CBS 123094]|uniref:Uncharacterized protein n=1 Tax=Amniculicola lignicola CBS 123094 TaxID=1392246 RepID=A0A6A5WUU8_9PLEO|nr:hypothetical protein P154DRAFT_572158 [Amniculicola lignicola CBS 123094]